MCRVRKKRLWLGRSVVTQALKIIPLKSPSLTYKEDVNLVVQISNGEKSVRHQSNQLKY
jgi:hypothetical protein